VIGKRGDVDPVPGQVVLPTGETLTVQVSPRGKSRRAKCRFDPLWVNFKKGQVEGTVFAGQNKLKLVTHCETKYAKKPYLANEYLAYRIFNLLSPYSFRVQPLNVTYVDTANGKSQRFSAFFIEHKKSLASRLDAEILETEKVSISQLDPNYAALVSVYQFLIANTDYSLLRGPPNDECCHNVVPLELAEQVYGIPYDFDSSGFVNPPYAAPLESLGLRSLTQRLYRGFCEHKEQIPEALNTIRGAKEQLYGLVRDFSAMPNHDADKVLGYLDKFYELIESPKRVRSKIVRKCR